MLAAPDPVAAFLDAHRCGVPVSLPTGGSSGAPRSVLRTTESWTRSFPAFSALAGVDRSARVWVPGPVTATMNLFASVHAVWAGASLVRNPEEATHAQLTPASLRALLDRDGPLPRLTAVVAGDRLPVALADRAASAGLTVHHYYGAAELSFVAWGAHEEDLRAFPEVAVEAREGRIWVRSPYLCTGYDGPPGPLRRDADGFATVGDRGRVDGARLVVEGREGAVTTAGATVHLAELEAALRPVAEGEIVAVGLRHDRLGAVLAVVVTREADHPSLVQAARASLPAGHRPRLWFHLPVLPRTAAGKVDRAALEALLTAPGGGTARRLA